MIGDKMIEVKIKRVFDPSDNSDGFRILVDRFWPRGIRKSDLNYDIWVKDVSPSKDLRHLLHSNSDGSWQSFTKGYRNQLETSNALSHFIDQISKANFTCITLLYAFHNKEHNHALILQEEIIKRLK